jgi:hypothetical protein
LHKVIFDTKNDNVKLIYLHKEWVRKGYMHRQGLCSSLPAEYREEFFNLFAVYKLATYWGYDGKNYNPYSFHHTHDVYVKYTPLRQTMVLLLCAINNEL